MIVAGGVVPRHAPQSRELKMARFRHLSEFCPPDIRLDNDLVFNLDSVQAMREYEDAITFYFEGGGVVTVHFKDWRPPHETH